MGENNKTEKLNANFLKIGSVSVDGVEFKEFSLFWCCHFIVIARSFAALCSQ
jgi:hypothetical protein